MYIPYVYSLKFTNPETGEKLYYIGSRTVSYRKTANPSDLFVTYFSSSKAVKLLIKKYGILHFKTKIIKIFATKTEALDCEKKFLARVDAMRNSKFINRSNGALSFRGSKMTEETKLKMSLAKRGKRFTDEHKANLKKNHKGNRGGIASATTRALMSIAQSGENNPMSGIKHSEEAIRKISEASKRMWENKPFIQCPNCLNQSKSTTVMKRWHFDNCKSKQ